MPAVIDADQSPLAFERSMTLRRDDTSAGAATQLTRARAIERPVEADARRELQCARRDLVGVPTEGARDLDVLRGMIGEARHVGAHAYRQRERRRRLPLVLRVERQRRCVE